MKDQFLKLLSKKEQNNQTETVPFQRQRSQAQQSQSSVRKWYTQSFQVGNDHMKLHNTKINTKGTCKCQLVRSASLWSLGLRMRNQEESIHIAYLALITNARHHIYIENQFFISSLAGKVVKNSIAECLVNRIKKAAEKRERFKVIVVMPLLPVSLVKYNFNFKSGD